MSASRETLERSEAFDPRSDGPPAAPGLILVFTSGRPASAPVTLDGGAEIRRDHPAFAGQPDGRMSRRHARVSFDGRRFHAVDLQSRNGTAVDGAPIASAAPQEVGRVVRVGDSLLVVARDLAPHLRLGVRVVGERVEGPALQVALQAAAQAARTGTVLHIPRAAPAWRLAT